MKIVVTSIVPNDHGGHTITIDTNGEKPGTESRIIHAGQDITYALQDGKISWFEGVQIIGDLAGIQ